jgi:NADH-quinone oxidoreductase E subunit
VVAIPKEQLEPVQERVLDIVSKYEAKEDCVLQILHDVQADNNSLSEAELIQVARAMDIPLSRVYGVATFYSMYSVRPRGKYVIRICESAPCHITGAQAVIRAFEQALGVKMGETTKDRKFTLEYTSCLGVCGVAPAVMINDQVYGNLTPAKVKEVLANYDED